MINDLNEGQKKLDDLMSTISERCYSAGWIENLEYVLWYVLLNGPQKYGQDLITREDIEYLRKDSTKCNCWIIFDDDNCETIINLTEWAAKYNNDISVNPNLLQQ